MNATTLSAAVRAATRAEKRYRVTFTGDHVMAEVDLTSPARPRAELTLGRGAGRMPSTHPEIEFAILDGPDLYVEPSEDGRYRKLPLAQADAELRAKVARALDPAAAVDTSLKPGEALVFRGDDERGVRRYVIEGPSSTQDDVPTRRRDICADAEMRLVSQMPGTGEGPSVLVDNYGKATPILVPPPDMVSN